MQRLPVRQRHVERDSFCLLQCHAIEFFLHGDGFSPVTADMIPKVLYKCPVLLRHVLVDEVADVLCVDAEPAREPLHIGLCAEIERCADDIFLRPQLLPCARLESILLFLPGALFAMAVSRENALECLVLLLDACTLFLRRLLVNAV